MISFQPTTQGKETEGRLAEKLRIIHYAVSLGHYRSRIFYLHTEELLAPSFKFTLEKPLDSWKAFVGDVYLTVRGS